MLSIIPINHTCKGNPRIPEASQIALMVPLHAC